MNEVVDVLKVSDVRWLRLIRYFKEMITFSALWILVGVMGLYFNVDRWGAYFWAAWIFWGVYELLILAFTPLSRKTVAVLTLLLALSLGGIMALLGQPDSGGYMAVVGIMISILTYGDVMIPKGVLLLTEKGAYFLATLYEEEVGEFMEKLGKTLFHGGASECD